MAQLPLFEGFRPVATHLSVSGKVKEESLQTGEPLRLGESVAVIVRGVVTSVSHECDASGWLIRVQKVSVAEAYAVSAEAAEELVDAARREAEQGRGITRLPLGVDPATGEVRR